jgi:sensor c-di-GMP phosphodiesterase-like protein
LGVRFSIDDFGTGYSSLAYLKNLPLNKLKVDQSFIRDVPANEGGAAIVETIIAMTRHLGLEVIAEGVETEAQCEFLRQKGCRHYQGYHFSRPLPEAEFLDCLQKTPVSRHCD